MQCVVALEANKSDVLNLVGLAATGGVRSYP